MRSVLSIRDLIAEMVRFLWLIVICALLGGVLLAGVKYAKDLSASKQVVEDVALSETFTEEEIAQINNYVAIKNRYLNYIQYVYSTPIMNLNANNVDTVSLQFSVTTDDMEIKDDVISSYIGYILYGNLIQDIESVNGEYKASDIQSFIKYIEREDANNKAERTGIIVLKVWGESKEDAIALAENVKNSIVKYEENLNENQLLHELELIDESYHKYYDKDLYDLQLVYTRAIDTEENAILNKEKNMTAAQLDVAAELLEKDETQEMDSSNVQKVGISKKFLVLGILLGGVGAAGLVLAWYILTATIKFTEEIRMVYGVRYLGQLSFKNKNKFEVLADKLLYASKLQPIETQKELLYSKILMTCENENIKEFVLTGEFGKNKEYAQELQKKLAENGVSVKVVGNILSQPEALKELKGEKNIIFVETIKRSRYENVHQEIVLCDEQNINVLGYIIFE